MDDFEKEMIERVTAIEMGLTNLKEIVSVLVIDEKGHAKTLENLKTKVAIIISIASFVSAALSAAIVKFMKL